MVLNRGYSVSLNTDEARILALGSPIRMERKFKNEVEVFSYDGENWNQMGSDIISNDVNDQFGYTLSLNSRKYSNNWGYENNEAFVYQWDESTWNQKGSNILGEKFR